MLGVWRAAVVRDGLTWTLTIQNNPNGTYHFEAQAEDHGACSFADRQWRTISAVTGQSVAGTFRVIDASNVELDRLGDLAAAVTASRLPRAPSAVARLLKGMVYSPHPSSN